MKKMLVLSCLAAGILAGPVQAQSQLADRLPSDALLYLEVADLSEVMEGLSSSSMGQIYHDPAMQEFLAGVMPMVQGSFDQAKAMATGMGLPAGVFDPKSYSSIQAGFSLRPHADGIKHDPEIAAGVQVTFSDPGLAGGLFDWVANMATSQGEGEVVDVSGTRVLRLVYAENERVEILPTDGGLLFWAQKGALPGENLSSTSSYQSSRSRMTANDPAVFMFVNAGAGIHLLEQVTQLIPEPGMATLIADMLQQSGLKALDTLAFSSGWKNGVSFTSVAIDLRPGEELGFFGAYTPDPADRALLEYIPDSATSFSINNADLDAVWETGRGLMQTLLKGLEAAGEMGALEGHPAHEWINGGKRQIMTDGLKGFGNRSFTYAKVDANSLMGGSSIGGTFVEVKDTGAVRNMLGEFMPELGSWLDEWQVPLAVKVKNVKRRVKGEDGKWTTEDGPEYYTMSVPTSRLPQEMRQMGMLFAQLQPSFGVTDDGWMVFNMSPASVRRALSKGVSKQEASIRENPEVEAFLERAPAQADTLTWSDPRPFVGGMVTMAQQFAPMVSAQIPAGQLPVDLNNIPGPDTFTKHLRPSEMYGFQKGNTIAIESIGSFEVADLVAGAGAVAVPVGMWVMARKSGMNPGHQGNHDDWEAEESVLVPIEEPTPHDDTGSERTQALRELERLQTGILVYELETGKLPAGLAALTQSADNYPKGFLPQPDRGLKNDPWGNPFVYRVVEGGGFVLYSKGANGSDDGGESDDIKID